MTRMLHKAEIKSLVCQYLNFRESFVLPTASVFGKLVDILQITPAGYYAEYCIQTEIKAWHEHALALQTDPRLARFWYVVPEELVDYAPDNLPEHIGILAVARTTDRYKIVVLRRAVRLTRHKVSAVERMRYLNVAHQRYLELRKQEVEYRKPDADGNRAPFLYVENTGADHG